MKLDKETLDYITNVVETARTVKIENIIIEPGKVRAIDEDRQVVLFVEDNVPDMTFKSIGLNRIDIFLSRLELAKSMSKFEVEATMDDKDEFARALTMKAKGIKVDYRCANPAVIQAPKLITDTVRFQVKMTPEAVLMMTKGSTAMGSDRCSFIGTKDGVSFQMEDINKDHLTYQFSTKAIIVDKTTDPSFNFMYPTKVLLALFKQNSDGDFHITTKGMLKISVNGLNFFIPPMMG